MQTELLNLGFLFLFAIIGGVLSAKFRQPFVIGLIAIGAVTGPHLLGLIDNPSIIELCIEFGAILCLFALGMEFSLKKLLKIGLKSGIVAILKVGIMFFIVFITIVLLGMDTTTAAFAGVALSFSSTMIITGVLRQKNLIKRKEVPLLIAVLILEDIFGIIALTFFSAVKESSFMAVINGTQHIAINMAVLVIAYLITSKFAEKMISYIMKKTSDETIIFFSLGLCSGFAYLAYVLGLSPSAGAFLAGSVVSNFKESKTYEKSVKPYTYIFSAFFFISMGTMVDFGSIIKDYKVLIILAIVAFLSLFIAMGLVTRVFAGFGKEAAVFSSLAMLPPGIFSMLVAKESLKFSIGIDLVAVVSMLILIHAVILNFFIPKSEKISEIFSKRKKTTLFGEYIKSVSNFFSNLLTELEIESAYTKEAKRKASRFAAKTIASIFVLIGISFVIKGFLGNPFDAILTAMLAIILLYLLYNALKDFKAMHALIIKTVSTLEAGMKMKKIRRGTKRLIFGSILIVIGIYSPFLIFMLGLEPIYTIMPISLVVAGLIMYIMAASALAQLTFRYKYTIHSYKKIVLQKNSFKYID